MFVLVVTSANQSGLRGRLARLADSHGARFYTVPKQSHAKAAREQEVERQFREVDDLYSLTHQSLMTLLNGLCNREEGALCSPIEEDLLYTLKELDIYEKMNVIERDQQVCRGYCWIPRRNVRKVQKALAASGDEAKQVIRAELAEIVVPDIHQKRPPTWIRLNSFTKQFQQIVNTYGVPAY